MLILYFLLIFLFCIPVRGNIAQLPEARYTTVFNQSSDALKQPDRKLFTVIIHDNSTGLDYDVASGDEIRAFEWSHGTAYSFVYDDNVYYAASPEQSPVEVTSERSGKVLHGSFDWMGNEDIVSGRIREGAMWFSPSDKYLAYASRPATSSKTVTMTTYTRGSAYDYEYKMEYPKTGEDAVAVYNVSIWNVEENKSVELDVQLRNSNAFHYLFGVSWVILHGKELLLTTWANRWQNETSLTLCSYETAACSLIYEHEYEPRQWAHPEDFSSMLYTENAIFFLLPAKIEDDSWWQHIAKIELTPEFGFKSLSYITAGAYDILRLAGYRADVDVIVYEAQAPHPWTIHVYASPVIGNSFEADICLTCGYDNCTYQQEAKLSSGPDFSIQFSCLGPSPPFEALISFNASFDQQEMKIITPPTPEDPAVTSREWTVETFVLPSGFEATARIYHGDTNLSSVPVTLFVYGGPGFNKAVEMFQAFPRPIGYKHAIVTIDVRGSNGRGWAYRSPVYGGLVTVEVEDTVEAMKMILDKYPRLDKNRVGVMGSSYGGTMAVALVEAAPEAFFKCSISVSPVINFIHYNRVYTERYMGATPLSSYTDLTDDVSKFRNTSLLLIHGLRDDNVHFQNDALLMESLQQENILFDAMVYPNEDHQLFKGNVKDHMFALFDKFLTTCYA